MYIRYLYGLCLKIGKTIFDSREIGIFIYTIIQCVASCLTFSFSIYYMAKKNVNVKYRVLALIFFIALPIFPFYSVWLTKDILFTLCITLITIGVIELQTNTKILSSKKYWVYMIVSLLLAMLFRKNGVYVVCILGAMLSVVNRKNFMKIVIMFAIPIIIFKVIDGPIRERRKIQDGPEIEMYSIPAQQMARIYKYDLDKLSKKDKRKIEQYIVGINISETYDPCLADPIKAALNQKVINENKKEFYKFCIKIFINYPARTMESFLCTTYRFYFNENEVMRGVEKYKQQSVGVIDSMLPQDINVKSNKYDIGVLRPIENAVSEKNIPMFATLCGCGIYINMCIMCIGYLVYKKEYKLIMAFPPIVLVMLTQLAGPVVDQRYAYSVFTCFPVLLATTIYIRTKPKK